MGRAQDELIRLTCGAGALDLAPELGGSVAAYRVEGRDILRPATPEALARGDVLATAGFPLVPFSGRIDRGRFTWAGVTHALPANFPPEPHAIHGHGWRAPWRTHARSEASAVLTYRHRADAWPWNYEASQTFTLREAGLTLEMSLTNLGPDSMPAGLGWHPYFPRGDAHLRAEVSAIWRSGADMIPAAPSAPTPAEALAEWRPVREILVDNAYEAAGARAQIRWPKTGVTVSISSAGGLDRLVVFTPPGADFFCVEPVSHAPDAVNSGLGPDATGLRSLAEGESLQAQIFVEIG